MKKLFITLALLALALPALAQDSKPAKSLISFDGCNTMTCTETGFCTTTLAYCGPSGSKEALLIPSPPDGLLWSNDQDQPSPSPTPVPSPTPAPSPTFFDWLKDHSSVISGAAVANGEQTEFVSVAVDTDFEIKPKVHGFGSVLLFGRQRVSDEGSVPVPGVPTSLVDLSLYSAGEVDGGAYWLWTPKVGIECRGGVTFAMIGITGSHGNPVDGSKFLGACGLRLIGSVGRLSVLAGHFGAVDYGAKFLGFAPTMIFDGEFKLPGNGISFVMNISAGRDLQTDLAVTSSRFAIRKAFR